MRSDAEPSAVRAGQCYPDMTNEQLVELAKGQDPLASDELYRRFKNMVRCKARPYFLMGADHEDLLQEGMIGFYKAVRDFDSAKNASFRSFAEMCVTRQLLTAIKSAASDKHMPLNRYESLYKPAYDESTDQLIDVLDSGSAIDPEELVLRHEYSTSVEQALNERLTSLEQSVLDLYLTGMSYAEIADALGRGTKTVDNALQRIRKKLEAPLSGL